jgi:hypothetical protein
VVVLLTIQEVEKAIMDEPTREHALGMTFKDLKREIEDGAIVAVSARLGQRVTRTLHPDRLTMVKGRQGRRG